MTFYLATWQRTSLLSIMADHQLTQLITNPTRVTPNSQTIIDHCYVSSSVSVASSVTAPLAESDHQRMYVTTIFQCRDSCTHSEGSPLFQEMQPEQLVK